MNCTIHKALNKLEIFVKLWSWYEFTFHKETFYTTYTTILKTFWKYKTFSLWNSYLSKMLSKANTLVQKHKLLGITLYRQFYKNQAIKELWSPSRTLPCTCQILAQLIHRRSSIILPLWFSALITWPRHYNFLDLGGSWRQAM